MKKPIIYIDLDDTVINTREGIYKLYEFMTEQKADRAIKTKEYADSLPQWENGRVNMMFGMQSDMIYAFCEPMPGALEAIQKLKDKYDIFFVTLQIPNGVPGKHMWVRHYLAEFESRIIYMSGLNVKKDMFVGHAFIDDSINNIETNNSTYPILYDYYGCYPQETRVSSWNAILKKLM